jgi:predicted NUDIX family NTP pyrophosphohydrolase
MVKKSAGILAYRKTDSNYEVFLVHPGGPYWAKKDLSSWSIPKGEFEDEEDPLAAAKREFREETGFEIKGEFFSLEPVKQPGGKIIFTWAVEADFDASKVSSNTFEMEWPPKTGRMQEFPEVDRGEWFVMEAARRKLLKGQIPILGKLAEKLGIEFIN